MVELAAGAEVDTIGVKISEAGVRLLSRSELRDVYRGLSPPD